MVHQVFQEVFVSEHRGMLFLCWVWYVDATAQGGAFFGARDWGASDWTHWTGDWQHWRRICLSDPFGILIISHLIINQNHESGVVLFLQYMYILFTIITSNLVIISTFFVFSSVVLMISCCSTPWGAMEVDPSQALEAQRKVRMSRVSLRCNVDAEMVHDSWLYFTATSMYKMIRNSCYSFCCMWWSLQIWSYMCLYFACFIVDDDENVMGLQTTSSTWYMHIHIIYILYKC